MSKIEGEFNSAKALEHIRHYLPSQAALKDFIHHNTLHAFEDKGFHDVLWEASKIFGYQTYLSINEFRELYKKGRIEDLYLNKSISDIAGITIEDDAIGQWRERLLHMDYNIAIRSRIGQLTRVWKSEYKINMAKSSYALLFRLLSSFLDQGISSNRFPVKGLGFLDSMRILDELSFDSIFRTKRPKKLLAEGKSSIDELLHILVGNEQYFEQYLFELHFGHPGWSGFVSVVEHHPETLLYSKEISLSDISILELLLQIDALDLKYGEAWRPLSANLKSEIIPLFSAVEREEVSDVLKIWQNAYEWTYYDKVLGAVAGARVAQRVNRPKFQALFCIDDREYTFRRHLERIEPACVTYGTPGFFGVEFFFQPENGKFFTKACPAVIEPKYLVREKNRKNVHKSDVHFHKRSHSLMGGMLISGIVGFWSALKLFVSLFKPSVSPATAFSFNHMDREASLEFEFNGEIAQNLKVGFTPDEMAERVGNVLKSIGLVNNFSDIVYVVGHGGSSVNNPYYAGYDCGACSGRPGAVNARVFAAMANKRDVRNLLSKKGIDIPDSTVFIGAMRDTTRDEIEFYTDDTELGNRRLLHFNNAEAFERALMQNALERSLRFENINQSISNHTKFNKVKRRSVSLFEPRPEWNHTDNAVCIVGRQKIYENIYFDKRPFINSYDYSLDSDGVLLGNILKAAIPVCSGINLEYYFSRVDQQNLGAGTKLPHNVVGLFAVNNGIDGDLRPGLPSQMIEIHEPVRLLFVIEHHRDVVLNTIRRFDNLYRLVKNEWVVISVVDPDTQAISIFKGDTFDEYMPISGVPAMMKSSADILKVVNKGQLILTEI